MKNKASALSNLMLAGLFAVVMSFTSCLKTVTPDDPCKGVSCDNTGVCADGVCHCPTGVEGAKCDSIWYAKFRGGWTVTDSSKIQKDTFYTAIDGSKTNAAVLTLNKFWIHGVDDIICDMTDKRSFSIRSGQNVYPGYFINYILKEGYGNMDASGQNIYGGYTITDPKNGDVIFIFHMTRN